MAWDEKKKKAWTKAYREKNREQINAYFREYYKKNKAKHLKRVNAWKKKNPDKLKKYAANNPENRKKRRVISKRYRDKNRPRWNEYQRNYKLKQQQARMNSKIIIPNAVKRKRWYFYSIDKDGNLCETKIRGRE